MVNLNLALNNLSFGFCSYHILKELHKQGLEYNLFPIAGNMDISTFDKTTPELAQYIQRCAAKAATSYSRKDPAFRLWHISGSEASQSNDNYLFVFHELDSLTPLEVNILNNQTKIFVSSNYSKKVFESYGVTVPVVYIPLGFDNTHFVKTNKKYYNSDIVVWSIFGKLEHRKRHEKTIRAWLKKFGNNSNHMLHLHVYNPFLKPEQNNAALMNILEGKRYSNINAIGYTRTLSELNENYNASSIVLDMSGAEGWSLPSFTCVGLGKHAVIHNVTAHKEWATDKNAVLVEPESKIEVYDGVFFNKGGPINQGNIFDWNEDSFIAACDKALSRYKNSPLNTEGLNIQTEFTWEKTVDKILQEISV
jgi:hypothetical protein